MRDTLVPLWQRNLAGSWDRTDDIGRDIVLLWGADSVIALDARTGDAVAATDGVEEYIGRDCRTLWFSVAGGGLKSLDLNTNGTIAIHNRIVRGAVRVEGDTAVAVVDGRALGRRPGARDTLVHCDDGPSSSRLYGYTRLAHRLDPKVQALAATRHCAGAVSRKG